MKKRKGVTLIEIIISLAIIGIIVIVILNMFNFSIANIFRSGIRTKSIAEVRDEIDEKISEIQGTTDGVETIDIIIPGVGNKTVKGTMITISGEDEEGNNEFNLEITTFVPNEIEIEND